MDCLQLNDVYNIDCSEGMRLLPAGKKYCIVTDPPFNIGYKYDKYKDRRREEEYLGWLNGLTSTFPCVFISYPEIIYKYAFSRRETPSRVISWVYNSNTARQHRDIAFFGVHPLMSQFRQPYKNPNDKRIRERIKNGCSGAALYDWFEINQVKNVSKDKGKISHPCVMPVEVMKRVVSILPKEYVIVDPFIGSGTTAVACINAGREFIGFEISENYFKIAKDRIGMEISNGSMVCKACGKRRNSGYFINASEFFCSDDCLHSVYSEEEYLEMNDGGNGESYWSDFDENGNPLNARTFKD